MIKKYLIAFSIILFCWSASSAQDTKLKILEQPKPELPTNYLTLDVQGTVVLKIQFLDFGEIGEITPLKTLPNGLTERAVVAARKINSDPEKKDGKPVTVRREIQYYYSWNGGWRFPAEGSDLSPAAPGEAGKAESIIARAVQNLGGERYLHVTSQIGRGKFSVLRDGGVISFQTFLDVLVFPDRERTDFRGGGARTVQVNTGSTGWVYDESRESIKDQNDVQIANFKQGIRTSLENLLRGSWKGGGELAYLGKRPSTLGKRNDVLRLTYKDDFTIEFEFSDDGLPQKAVYKRLSADNEEVREEDHYAQFIDIDGVKTPFIIDRLSNGVPASRINYESVEFNKAIPASVFAKPSSVKDAKKDIKF